MRERVVKFGRSAALVGILSEPAVAAPGRPAVVMLDSGIMHRVGACRWHVRVARRLAEAGFTVLRFDFSGIGDSEPRKDQLPFEQSAELETREAMDWLARTRGASSFLLMGLCSGADMSHQVALADERVVGIAVLDPYAYRTTGYWMRHYGRKLFSVRAWKRWLKVRAARLAGARRALRPALEGEGVTFEVPTYVRAFPPRERIAGELRALVARGVRMLLVFTDGQVDHINHGAQYARAFPDVDFRGLLQVDYMDGASHIVTAPAHQQRVADQIEAWVRPWATAALTAPAERVAATPPGVPAASSSPARQAATAGA